MAWFAYFAWFACFAVAPAWSGAGTTGANFLRIGPGARQAGMAEAATGIADDAVSALYNPASTAFLTQVELHFMHLAHWEGVNYEFATFGTKLSQDEGFGWNLALLDAGKMDQLIEDATGTTYTTSGTFTFQNVLAAINYSRFIDNERQWTLGGNFKAIIEQAASSSRFGVGLDLGAIWKRPVYQLGLAILNLGPAFGGADGLPLTIRTGLSTTTQVLTPDYNDLLMGFDLLWLADSGRFKANFGAELWFINVFAARLGYKAGYELESFTFGTGFKSQGEQLTWQLDYAFVPTREAIGSSHRFELLLKFILR